MEGISITAFRPAGLYPIASMDISACMQGGAYAVQPVVTSRHKDESEGTFYLEYSYQGDPSPHTSLIPSPSNHPSFP